MTASIWNGSTVIGSTANADNSYLVQRFGAPTEGQTLFTLTSFSYAVGTNSLEVFIDGVRQVIGTDFTETSPTSFTLLAPGARATDVVDAVGLVGSVNSTGAAASAAASAASATASSGFATAAQASYLATLALVPASLPLSIANGGTGNTTKAASFIALAPAPVAGQVIGSVDGVTFAMVAPGLVVSIAITANTTLTAANMAYHTVAMASLGQSVTLPDATTIAAAGSIKTVLDNTKGAYPAGIRDSTGVLIGAIAAGGQAIVSLRDKSTAAGVWGITGTGLEPGLLTVDTTLSSTFSAASIFKPFAALDNNTSIHFVALSSGFAAVVVDNTGKVTNTPVTVSSTATHKPAIAFRIDATHAIVFYGSNTSADNNAVVLTLTGASPSFSLSVGTPVTVASAMANGAGVGWGGEDTFGVNKIIQLSASLYLCHFTSGGNHNVVALSVAGAVITAGAAVAGALANEVLCLYPITATTALSLYNNTTTPNAAVISVAGTVCTINAPVSGAVNPSGALGQATCQLTTTKVVILGATASSPTTMTAVCISVAGTVPTWNAALSVEVGISGVDLNIVGFTSNNTTRYNPRLSTLTATTALLWYLDGNGKGRAVILTESAGTLTKGNILYSSISVATSTTSGAGYVSTQGVTDFCAVQTVYGGVNSKLRIVPYKIAGTNITVGAAIDPDSVNSAYGPYVIACARTSLGKQVFAGQTINEVGGVELSSLSVMTSNGDSIAFNGAVKIPPITPLANAAYFPPTVSPNRLVLVGAIAQSTVGISTGQVRILNVELAA